MITEAVEALSDAPDVKFLDPMSASLEVNIPLASFRGKPESEGGVKGAREDGMYVMFSTVRSYSHGPIGE